MDPADSEISRGTGGEAEELLAAVESSFAFLKKLSYEGPSITRPAGTGNDRALVVRYENRNAHREVTISTHEADSGRRITVAIWRIPFETRREDMIDLSVFLWKHHPETDLCLLDLDSYSGSTMHRVKSLLSFVSSILQTKTLGFIEGNQWEEGLIDI